ncbi:MAG: DUF58 domain-containing protein [Acidimicrobiales bacterium]
MTGRDRYRLVLTPAGAGVLSLFFPGLLIAGVTRQRLLVAISVGAGLILVLNAIIARLALRRVGVTVDAPDRATAGQELTVVVAVDGPAGLECVVGIERSTRPWVAAVVPCRGPVDVAWTQRGTVTHLTIRLQTAVPFGLAAFVRLHHAPLAEPLLVGPAPIAVAVPLDPGAAADQAWGTGDPVGVRDYAPGDRRRDVHWPTVARTGRLMVVERGGEATTDEMTIVVDAAPGDDLDDVLGRARAAVEALLASGRRVDLTTCETRPAPGPGRRRPAVTGTDAVAVTGPVADRRELIARLAVADAGPVPTPVPGLARPTLVVSPEGLRWASPS